MGILDNFKKELSEIGKRIYNKGLTPGTSGNISIRYENNILISSSGSCLGDMEDSDIVILNINGDIIEGNNKPSSEKEMHLEIYRKRSDITSIIHVHPPKSTAFSVAGIPLDSPILSEVVFALGQIPVAEYATPSSDKLASTVSNYFLNHDAVLLANHGVVIGGQKLKETFYKLETLESYAEIYLWTKLLGSSNELSQDNIQELIQIRQKMFKQLEH